MKNILFISILLLSTACEKEITTGIKGNVKYGSGDCMPGLDNENIEPDNYTGNVYFFVKSELDNLEEGGLSELKEHSIKVKVKDGDLAASLPVDSFVVMVEDYYLYSEYNTIAIKANEVLQRDFIFFKCTSY